MAMGQSGYSGTKPGEHPWLNAMLFSLQCIECNAHCVIAANGLLKRETSHTRRQLFPDRPFVSLPFASGPIPIGLRLGA